MNKEDNSTETRALREIWFTVETDYDLRRYLAGDRPSGADKARYAELERLRKSAGVVLIEPIFPDESLRPVERVAMSLDPQRSKASDIELTAALLKLSPRSSLSPQSPLVQGWASRLASSSRAQGLRMAARLRSAMPMLSPYYRLRVYWPEEPDPERDPRQLLEGLPGVRAAYDAPLLVQDSGFTPTDPWFDPAGGYEAQVGADPMSPRLRDQWSVRRIRAPVAWGFTTGEGVTVGVVDSGVDPTHRDLRKFAAGSDKRVLDVPGKPGKADPHGSLVAGIIAAESNDRGVCGIAPGAKIFACVYGGRVPLAPLSKTRRAVRRVAPEPADWIAGIVRAVDAGAKVINCSWHLEVPCCAKRRERQAGEILREAILVATQAGVTVVCSMGNRSHYNTPRPYESWPAHLNGQTHGGTELVVIGVGGVLDGASPEAIVRHIGSNYGPSMTLVAPSREVPSTDLSGREGRNRGQNAGGQPSWFDDYAPLGGTSAAAAHVSGVVALMLSVNPKLTPAQVRAHLAATALKVGTLVTDGDDQNDEYGYGMVQATAAARVAGEVALERILSVLPDLDLVDRRMARLLLDGFMSHTEVGQVFAGRFWQVSEELAALLSGAPETAEDVRELLEELYPLIRATLAPTVLSRRLDKRRSLRVIRLLVREIQLEGPSAALKQALLDAWQAAREVLMSDASLADALGADSVLRKRRGVLPR